MNRFSPQHVNQARGVTLIELMIVVVIIAIIAAFAYPSYINQAHKAGRSDATSALLAIAAAQEKEFLKNNAYTNDLDELGITETENNKYNLTLTSNGDEYLAVAKPSTTGDRSQVGDKGCTEFSIDQTGAKRSKGLLADADGNETEAATLTCW